MTVPAQRVGILTFHYTENYGSVLQAYGLWSYLRSRGFGADILDYRPPVSRLFRWKYSPSLIRHFGFWGLRAGKFLYQQSTLSHRLFSREDLRTLAASGRYDAFICGGDEIWKDSFPRFFDPAYYLSFVDGRSRRKLSYAACSATNRGILFGWRMKPLLRDLRAIGVRDATTAALLRKLGFEAREVLDPTFLADWNAVASDPVPMPPPYLLVYGDLAVNAAEVRGFSRQKRLRTMAVLAHQGWADENRTTASPAELLGLFRKADCVVTNTYHGALLSIQFRKPFVCVRHPDRGYKVDDILCKLGIEDRLVAPGQVSQRLSEPVDYASVGMRLAPLRAASESFLQEALGDAGVTDLPLPLARNAAGNLI